MEQTRRILVIDDNKDIHDDFRKVFESIGRSDSELDALEADLFGEEADEKDCEESLLPAVTIDSAFQGEEGVRMALEAAQEGRPYDMAFVDVRMPPGIDGVQTIKKLWTQLCDLQCVICTAYSDYDWEQIVRQVGKSGNLLILKKPFDAIEVLQLAQSLVQKTDLARATREYQGKLERQVRELTRAETELRLNNEQLEAARTEAEAANQAKSEFLANISHELRTPLNAVIGMTELLLDAPLEAQQQKYARTVKSSGETLLKLIDEILDFSKIEAGKLELEQIEFELLSIVEPVIDVVAPKCATKSLELASFVDPAIPRELRGDPGRLRQVLTNLANNAVKFTERGEVVIRVSLAERHESSISVRFAVQDTGIGVPSGRQHRLFRSFSQVDPSTTRKYGGTGLGLVISKQLCELMGGHIGVQSEQGKGSTFWFTVPVEAAGAGEPHRQAFPPEVQGTRVLVATENETCRNIFCEQLQAWGCETQAIAGGRLVLETLREAARAEKPFRIAMLELGNPESGHELGSPESDHEQIARLVNDAPELRDTVLIALLPMGNGFETEYLQTLGFSGCLTKPIMQSELYNAVVDALLHADFCGRSGSEPRMFRQPARSKGLPKARHHGARILLAEDNDINQLVAAEILKRAGYDCEVVADGQQALDALEKMQYDLVLMDCQMPVMDGFEATRRIRLREQEAEVRGQRSEIRGQESEVRSQKSEVRDQKSEVADQRSGASTDGLASSRSIPVIALTANAMKGDRDRCLVAGMTDYVSKPLNPEKLIDAIEKCLAELERGEEPAHTAEPVADPQQPAGDAHQASVASSHRQMNDLPESIHFPRRLEAAATSAGAESPAAVALDYDALLNRCLGNAEFVVKILATFKKRVPQDLEQLEAAIRRRDAAQVGSVGHALKGAAANVSAEALRDLAGQLEEMGKAGALEGAQDCIDRLRTEWQRFCQTVSDLLNSEF